MTATQQHEKLCRCLKNRTAWESKQDDWYRMRHDGLPRRGLENWQSNLHFAIGDDALSKLVTYDWNQIFAQPRIAEFKAMAADVQESILEAAADAVDWLLKSDSEFLPEYLSCLDSRRQCGIGVMKVFWDPSRGLIDFACVHPTMLIVPGRARRLDEEDLFAEVRRMTKAQYQRSTEYDQMVDLARIGGKGQATSTGVTDQTARETREGVTHGSTDDEIVVWEVWELESAAAGWLISTFSPVAPEIPLRQPFRSPYRWAGRPVLPYVEFPAEIKVDRGYYTSRGTLEKVAPHEKMTCGLMNAAIDCVKFWVKPLLQHSGAPMTTTAGNFRLRPGEVLPQGLAPAQPQANIGEALELAVMIRTDAQQRVQQPDFGIGREGDQRANKTAREVSATQEMNSAGVNMSAWLGRLSLSRLLTVAWCMLVTHARTNTGGVKYFAGKAGVLPQEALSEALMISPSGSAELVLKPQRMQRAVARFQMFNQNPIVNQEELVRSVITEDDPTLVSKLIVGSGQKQASEAEDEAMELQILQDGWPATVNPAEDHMARLQILVGWLQSRTEPLPPVAQQRVLAHIQQHVQELMKQNPQLAKQVMAQIQQRQRARQQIGQPAPAPAPTMSPEPPTAQTVTR